MTTTPFRSAAAVQKQMWVVDRIDPGASIYNEDIAFWIDGDLRADVLDAAWRRLAERHEVLRYVFDVQDADLRLRAVPEADLSFVTVERATEQEALAWGTDLVQQTYDITVRPPVRFGLARVGTGRHLLVIGFHHAIIDVGSIGLLFEELSQVYSALLAGREPDLPPVERTYSDYIAWAASEEHRRLVDDLLPQVVARLTAAGGARSAELPADRPRGPVRSTHGRLTEAAFPAGIVKRLRAFAAEHRVTPFHVLLAGMTALLRRYTRLDEMIFGVGSSGRPDGFEDVIGPLACFVPVRASIRATTTFADLLDDARRTTFDMAGAQFVPFSRVVSEVITTRDPSRSPLVQIVFNAPPLSFRSDVLEGCGLHPARLPRSRARVDLLVNLEWAGDDIIGSAEFDDSLYDDQTITTFVGQLGVLIDEALEHPGLPVDALPIPWPAAPVPAALIGPATAGPQSARVVGPEGAWCVLGEDGFVATVSGEPELREPGGLAAPVGVEADLLVDGQPIPGVRVRRLADGRLRWRRPDERQAARESVASRGSRVERHVVDVCRELLEDPEAAPDDDFFVAGGHSMLAARLVQRLGDEFGVDVPLLIVFEHPVLSDLAGELEAQFPEVDQVLERLESLSDSELAGLGEQSPPDADTDDPGSVGYLSGHEQPFWLMEQFAPGSSVNTLTLRIHGSGRLDVAALEYAVNQIIDRQEILRTSYGTDENMNPVRHVHAHAPARISVHRTDAEGALRLAKQESTTGFDISQAPLLRCAVACTGADEFEILLSYHHLVMDYWGVTRVMLPEVSAFYRERVSGVAPALASPEGYRRAILRDVAWRDSARARAGLAYWREQLQGMRAAEFRPDHPRPDHVDFCGAAASSHVPPELVRRIDEYLTANGTTLFVVVAAAVAATARAWSGTDDVSFMSPVENRRDEADARVMGTFVNLVTLRFRVAPELTWDELVAQSRRVTLDAYANQSVPVSAALASVGQQNVIASDQGRYLVLNVFSDRTGLHLDGCRIDGGAIVPHESASTDLELSVMSAAGRLELTMKYRASLWDAATVERILHDVVDALGHVVTDGAAAVAPAHRTAGDPVSSR